MASFKDEPGWEEKVLAMGIQMASPDDPIYQQGWTLRTNFIAPPWKDSAEGAKELGESKDLPRDSETQPKA
ncbi:MAG: hypothetical protein M0R74_02600 [Dehalococcoidia bacterium]|nr:hypothetical protein [Dehalococcoidia bacterium]